MSKYMQFHPIRKVNMPQIKTESTTALQEHSLGISTVSDSSIYVTTGNSGTPMLSESLPSQLDTPKLESAGTFVPAVSKSAFVKSNSIDAKYAALYSSMEANALRMTKGQLQAIYAPEYNSLRSRRQQARLRHIKFADSLKDIRDWLIHLGPRPVISWTVDRIKSAKGYQPGNLRWASKLEQTQNRKITKWHTMPEGGFLSTKRLAERLNLPYPTVYKRLRSGWTVERLLADEGPYQLESWNFPKALATYCRPLYQQRKNYKQTRIDWFIEHLHDVLYDKLGDKFHAQGDAIGNLIKYRDQAKSEKCAILKRQSVYEADKLNKLLIILANPPI